MKHKFLIALLLLAFAACKKYPEPEVETVRLHQCQMTVLSREVSYDCHYVYPNKLHNATLQLSKKSNFFNVHTVDMTVTDTTLSATLTGLETNTRYYCRIQFESGKTHSWSVDTLITTLPASVPTVNTAELHDIMVYSAQCGGTVTNDGGYDVTARGVCWRTASQPTIEDSHSTDGAGTGSFASELPDLLEGRVYYVRAYATNSLGTGYGEERVFSTEPVVLPEVSTNTIVRTVTDTSAWGGGVVLTDGHAPITARGLCWSKHANPTLNDPHTTEGDGLGLFYSQMLGLEDTTTFHVRAYATNMKGTGYGEDVSFTTPHVTEPMVETLSADAEDSYSVICRGHIVSHELAPVTERGFCYSKQPNPTFADGRTRSGQGSGDYEGRIAGLIPNTTYYVRAYAINRKGLTLGEVVSFTTPQTTELGELPGLFSVSPTKKVRFSKGNLQYRASTDTWRFAEHQWDFVGDNYYGNVYENGVKSNNNQISSTYDGWIDYFSYASSGYNGYMPYSFSLPWENWAVEDIAGTPYDWGVYNAISNGGNEAGLWRTLTVDEWAYLIGERENVTQKMGYARVNNVYGIVLLPDEWTLPEGLEFKDYQWMYGEDTPGHGHYTIKFWYVTATFGQQLWYNYIENWNVYNESQWEQMEANGALFLTPSYKHSANYNLNIALWQSTRSYEGNLNHFWAKLGIIYIVNGIGTNNVADVRLYVRLAHDSE